MGITLHVQTCGRGVIVHAHVCKKHRFSHRMSFILGRVAGLGWGINVHEHVHTSLALRSHLSLLGRWGGVGWVINLLLYMSLVETGTCKKACTFHATLPGSCTSILTYIMLRCSGVGWGDRGWAVDLDFNLKYIARVLALPHIRHATLLDVLLHFDAYVMLPCWMFSCTSTHTSWYI